MEEINDDEPSERDYQAFILSTDPYYSLDSLSDEKKEVESPLIPLPQSWKRINSKPHKEHSWRIQDLIPGEGFMILASVSGEKKTWVAMEMARCIVAGIPFLQHDGFKTRACNVLYINCENPESEIQRRGRQLGFSDSTDHKLYIINADSLNLNDEDTVERFLGYIKCFKIDVVFVDTFRAVAGALKEEKAEEIRQFFNRFMCLKNGGVSVVWLDHFRKPSNFEGKIPKKEHLLGSQDKTASIETLLMIRSDNGSDTIDCYQRKNRLAIELKPFQISMVDHEEEESGARRTVLSYAGELDAPETKKDQAKEIILELLTGGGKTTNEILGLLKAQIGSRNIRDALKELEETKAVDVARRLRQNYYFLVPEEQKSGLEEEFSEEK